MWSVFAITFCFGKYEDAEQSLAADFEGARETLVVFSKLQCPRPFKAAEAGRSKASKEQIQIDSFLKRPALRGVNMLDRIFPLAFASHEQTQAIFD